MKLDLKDYSAPLVTEISRLLGVAPMLTMCAAVLMLVITTFAVRDFVANQQQEERSMRLPQFKIQSAPVPKSLYQEYAATLARLSPVV
ncbi:MAG TPA: hypothetical protein VFV57_06755, partial [Limnobacter sp.]|nr:hypothetical protein [Limnobacter sp.]